MDTWIILATIGGVLLVALAYWVLRDDPDEDFTHEGQVSARERLKEYLERIFPY